MKLRLMRMGKKKQPTYRVVAADERAPRDGRFIEVIGTYEPRAEPSRIKLDNDKAVSWLRRGAQPTEPVQKLLKISGAWEQFQGPSGASGASGASGPPEPATQGPSGPAERATQGPSGP